MKKKVLFEKTNSVVNETKEALQTFYDALNTGQKKKVLKNEAVKKMLDKYKVDYVE